MEVLNNDTLIIKREMLLTMDSLTRGCLSRRQSLPLGQTNLSLAAQVNFAAERFHGSESQKTLERLFQ